MSDSSVYLSPERCGGVCLCVCVCVTVHVLCACMFVCVHTVGVCGRLFVLNGHLYSSFMSRAAILRDRILSVCVCVYVRDKYGSLWVQAKVTRFVYVCVCVMCGSQIVEQSRGSGSRLCKKCI